MMARRLNRRSGRRVAARRRARVLAMRAADALVWVRHSFATRERGGKPVAGMLAHRPGPIPPPRQPIKNPSAIPHRAGWPDTRVNSRAEPSAGGKLAQESLRLSLSNLSLSQLNPNLKPKFVRSTAAATSDASFRRAVVSVRARCAQYSKRCRPRPAAGASDRGSQGPNPNGVAGDVSRHAFASLEAALQPVSLSGAAAAPTARALVADMLSLPQAAGAVDLLSALPVGRRLQYASAANTLWRATDRPATAAHGVTTPEWDERGARLSAPPKPCKLASAAEWAKTVTRMYNAGMIAFPQNIVAECGIFAVDKTDGRLRAITDARPANWHFAGPDPVTLPTPDVIARLRAPPGTTIFVARTDAADFYHSFKTPEWMWEYFGLPRVRARDLPAAARAAFLRSRRRGAVDDDEWVQPALCTLPMGYSHAVLLAQEAHIALLDTMPELFARRDRLADPMCTDYTLSAGRVLHAVCIDDVLLFGTNEALVALRQRLYLRAGRSAGFVYKNEKLVLPTADGAPVLGMELHGREGTLRLKPEKMEALVAATRAAVNRGVMRVVDFQSLLGHWVWASLPCRPALSILSAVFALAQSMRRGTVSLWPAVRRELLAMADIAPLLAANLHARAFGRVMASDASETGLGVVAIDPALAPDRAPALSTVPGVRAVVGGPADARAVTPIVSARWHWKEHINRLEFRAAHTALRWVLRHALPGGVRVSLWSDSAVVVGVLRKGRSCSTPLNRLMRALAADLLLANVSVEADWVPSALNPADAASRA